MKPKSTKNRWKNDFGPVRAPKAVSGTRPDALGTVFGHPYAAPKSILGRPGRAKSGQEPSQSVPRASQRHSKSIWGDSQDARKRHSHHPTQLKAFADRFLNIFGRCAAAPKCVSYRSCQCFIDVGRFARRALAARKNLEKQAFRALKSRPGASWGTSGEQVRTPKRRSRAKKRVRSASRASANLKVSANEATSSERARLQAAQSARASEDSEGKFRNLRMDIQIFNYFNYMFKNFEI